MTAGQDRPDHKHMKVFITIDTEIWCNGWSDLDRQFPKCFEQYVYGPTSRGNYALPYILDVLSAYGLRASFFVEALFSARFGLAPLSELIGLIKQSGQEVQLHLHPEWVSEVGDQLLTDRRKKTPRLSDFTISEQEHLLAWGKERLVEAGADGINAFRAGSYAANSDTLRALAATGLTFDSSYNLAGDAGVSDIGPGNKLTQACQLEGVYEYPVSVLDRGGGNYRIVQITALSLAELVSALEHAYDANWQSFVVVCHNFEVLSPSKSAADKVVARRLERFCRYLSTHPDRFQVSGFTNLTPQAQMSHPEPIKARPIQAAMRILEQGYRTIRYR